MVPELLVVAIVAAIGLAGWLYAAIKGIPGGHWGKAAAAAAAATHMLQVRDSMVLGLLNIDFQ